MRFSSSGKTRGRSRGSDPAARSAPGGASRGGEERNAPTTLDCGLSSRTEIRLPSKSMSIPVVTTSRQWHCQSQSLAYSLLLLIDDVSDYFDSDNGEHEDDG